MSATQWNLPLALLDLTFAQSRQNLASLRSGTWIRRNAHALALKSAPEVRNYDYGDISQSNSSEQLQPVARRRLPPRSPFGARRPQAAHALEQRVNALLDQQESNLAPTATDSPIEEVHYDESELQNVYTDLLAHPENNDTLLKQAEPLPTNPEEILQALVDRLFSEADVSWTASSSTSSSLASQLAGSSSSSKLNLDDESDVEAVLLRSLDPDIQHHKVVQRLHDVVGKLQQARKAAKGDSLVPVAVVSETEWNALVQTSIQREELALAAYTLELCRRSGSHLPEASFNELLDTYARVGQVDMVLELFDRFNIAEPTGFQRDLHVKAYLRTMEGDWGIPKALSVLHEYEAKGLFPAEKTYGRLICALFRKRTSQEHAQAWDLFSHMRYVAHPNPDVFLYSIMIKACAGTGHSHSGYASDPVRALDLWNEMINDAKLTPTVHAYNSIILACARSHKYAPEAFRLAREMLDSHRDAYGNPLMRPDKMTFIALFVAAKSRRDLGRTRWLLAEMLKLHEAELREGRDSALAPDENVIMHVFHSYTSYVPPFRRSQTRIVDEQPPITSESADVSGEQIAVKPRESAARFGVAPPQSSAEVLAEVDVLMGRILEDSLSSAASESSEDLSVGPFSRVVLSQKVVNAYLAVHHAHAPLEDARNLYHEIYQRTGTQRNSRTCVEALERCARSEKQRDERPLAKTFAEEIWNDWLELEKTMDAGFDSCRWRERAYAAMIRCSALLGDLDRSMRLVREFAARFPPGAVSIPSPKPAMRSTRTLLYANRPIVRLTTPSEVPDDTVPPVLSFRDLELLHHRLVAAGFSRQQDVAYIKYLCKAYEGNLRKRRDATIRA